MNNEVYIYKVKDELNGYYKAKGKQVLENRGRVLLEIEYPKELGGIHRVMFYKHQLELQSIK